MKNCKDCGIEKPLTEYYKAKHTPDGYYYRCKKCDYKRQKDRGKKYAKKYQAKVVNDEEYSVYFLPYENYVGQTKQLKYRLYSHKRSGKNIKDYRVLTKLNTRELALELESLLHSIGYKGKSNYDARF